MYYKPQNIILLMIVYFFIYASLSLADSATPRSVIDRLEVLEKHKDLLEKDYENKDTAMTKEFEALKRDNAADFRDMNAKLRDDYKQLSTFIYIVGPLALGAIIISIIVTILKIRNYAESKIKEVLSEIFNDRKGAIAALIDKHDAETQLKRTKTILVLTPPHSDKSFLTRFFLAMGFSKVDSHYSDEQLDYTKYNLVFFNDKDDLFDKRLLQRLIQELPKTTIRFYFGPSRINIPNEYSDSTAIANVPLQLYGNLINALRYQSIL